MWTINRQVFQNLMNKWIWTISDLWSTVTFGLTIFTKLMSVHANISVLLFFNSPRNCFTFVAEQVFDDIFKRFTFELKRRCHFYFQWHSLSDCIERRTMGQTAPKRPETPILEWISPILILMVLICPYGSPWVPLVPKSHYKLVEVFKFTRYVARNHMQFWPFSSFQWNHFHDLHVSSDVLDSSGHTGILWKTCKNPNF